MLSPGPGVISPPPGAPRGPRRWARGALVSTLLLTLAIWVVTERVPGSLVVVERLLALAPPRPECGHPLGLWSALLHDEAPARAPVACYAALVGGPRTELLMERVALDRRHRAETRGVALAALADAGVLDDRLILATLLGAGSAPMVRQALADALLSGPEWERWASVIEDVPLHDLPERAALERARRGDEEQLPALLAVLPQAELHPDDRASDAALAWLGLSRAEVEDPRRILRLPPGWGEPISLAGCGACVAGLEASLHRQWREAGGDDAPPADPLPGVDEAVESLHASRPEAGEALRRELAWLAGWARLADDERVAAARVESAALHPEVRPRAPEEVWAEAGRPHGVLAAGGGDPRDTAFLLDALRRLGATALTLRWEGPGLYVDLGGRGLRVGACGGVSPAEGSDGVLIEPGQAVALSLVNAVGRALRAGRWEDAAGFALDAARAWPDGPGVQAALGVAAAASGHGGAARAASLPSPDAPRRARRGRRLPPPRPLLAPVVPAPPAPVGAERAAMLALSGEARWLAAWWAERSGRAELRGELLAELSPPDDLPPPLRMLGEPGEADLGEARTRAREEWEAAVAARCPAEAPLAPGPAARVP